MILDRSDDFEIINSKNREGKALVAYFDQQSMSDALERISEIETVFDARELLLSYDKEDIANGFKANILK